jgi:hypothetical protein
VPQLFIGAGAMALAGRILRGLEWG